MIAHASQCMLVELLKKVTDLLDDVSVDNWLERVAYVSSSYRVDTSQVLILPPTIPLGKEWGLLHPQVTIMGMFGNEMPTYNLITVAICQYFSTKCNISSRHLVSLRSLIPSVHT